MAFRGLPGTAEQLAAAARTCPVFVAARTLADWVGTGRDVTTRLVLKPAAAVEVCDLLGIELPSRKPRSALDIPPLMTVWAVAVTAGLIEVDRGRVRPGPAFATWEERAEDVLEAWTRCAQDAFGLVDEMDEDDVAHLAVLATLHENADAVPLDDLSRSVDEVCGPDLFATGRASVSAIAQRLAEFGIVVAGEDAVEPTPLGRHFTDVVFRQGAPATDVDAEALIGAVSGLPSRLAVLLSRPWLSSRDPEAAARELLAVAARASGERRLTAIVLVDECGPEAEPAWREWARDDGFGAYARSWLADAAGTEPSEDDKAWLTVDTVVTALDALPPGLPPVLVAEAAWAQIGGDPSLVVPLLAKCGHPDAPRLVALLGDAPVVRMAAPPPPRPDRVGVGYELEVRLLEVANPPVWRRLEVPAGLSLGGLHEVVQAAMGWENAHLHEFAHRTGRYGVPDADLGHQDESAVAVSQVLAEVGDRIAYSYDFGDGWEHDITLKKIVPAGDPVCTAGEGACPPEDCGGPWGYEDLKATLADPTAEGHADLLDWLGLRSGADFDPARFSTEDANRALKRLA
ncbi:MULTISPECIES: plasmid pRiA4b ORF-3 family protein [unclassified Saccharothrix]|uniref:plasmid pRiA4b ORF-3 family protein n=1 Tax=unclassified Saccharothrix TaxID=2593673 RepID=UPI00307E3D56